MSRGHVTFLLKLALSIVLLWLVLSRLTWAEVRSALTDPHWAWLVAALVVYGLSAWGGAQQWAWILRTAGLATPGGEIRRLYFIGLFFNNFLPANIGGDAYKIIDLGRRENCAGRVFCATLLDRLIGLAALTVVASVAAIVCRLLGIALPQVVWILALVLAFLGCVLAFLVSRRLCALLPRLLWRLRVSALARRAETLAAEFANYRQRSRWLAAVFLFSLAVQSLRILVHLLVAVGLRLDPSAVQMLQLTVLVPLLALSLTLPITVNGIGLREVVASALLVHTGLSAHGVVAMEMVAFLVLVLFSLSGGVLWWRGRRPAATTVQEVRS